MYTWLLASVLLAVATFYPYNFVFPLLPTVCLLFGGCKHTAPATWRRVTACQPAAAQLDAAAASAAGRWRCRPPLCQLGQHALALLHWRLVRQLRNPVGGRTSGRAGELDAVHVAGQPPIGACMHLSHLQTTHPHRNGLLYAQPVCELHQALQAGGWQEICRRGVKSCWAGRNETALAAGRRHPPAQSSPALQLAGQPPCSPQHCSPDPPYTLPHPTSLHTSSTTSAVSA